MIFNEVKKRRNKKKTCLSAQIKAENYGKDEFYYNLFS